MATLRRLIRRGCLGSAHKQRGNDVLLCARSTTFAKPQIVQSNKTERNNTNVMYAHTNKWDIPYVINKSIRGDLVCKLDEITKIKDDYGMDVLATNETWCKTNIPDSSLSSSGFDTYCIDKQDRPTRPPPKRGNYLLRSRHHPNLAMDRAKATRTGNNVDNNVVLKCGWHNNV